MARYSGDLIKLNGKSYKCITSYKIQRNKGVLILEEIWLVL